MKKMIILAALLCSAAVGWAQVTFTCTAGKNFGGNEGAQRMFDGNTATKFCTNAGTACYALFTASEPVYVWGYDMTTANDSEGNDRRVKSLIFCGTNDASVAANPNADGWVTLSSFEDKDYMQRKNFYTQRYFCDKSAVTTPYKYFKVVFTRGGGDRKYIQVSKFEPCYETYKPVTYNWFESDGGDGSKKAVDWDLGQKWEGSQALQGKYLTIETADGNAYPVKSYSFTTHDDGYYKDRAPKEWKLEGSNDNTNWTLVDEQTGGDPIANEYYQTTVFTPSNTTDAFRYLRLTLNTMKANEYQQIGEFHVTAVDESVSAQSVCSSARLASAKALFEELSSVLGTTDPWYIEYKALYDTLDGLFAAENWTDLTANIDKMDAWAGRIALFQTQNAVALDGSSTWGDGHWSQLVDGLDGQEGRTSTKWGGNFSGAEGSAEHVQWVIFRQKTQMTPYFYKLVTGGDTKIQQGRNWKDWDIFGANFATIDAVSKDAAGWVKLDSRTDISEEYLPMENNYPAMLNFTEGVSEPYFYYMVKVYKSGGSQQQMSEIILCTEDEFDAMRDPFVDEFKDFAENTNAEDVEESQRENLATFLTLYAELKTTSDAVRLTIVYNQMKTLFPALKASKAIVKLTKSVTKVGDFFQLGTVDDVKIFAAAVNVGAYYNINGALTADVNLTGSGFEPIGNTDNYYVGTFNGNGHVVTINIDSDQPYQGFFGCAGDGASISNLILRGSVKGNGNTAALIGEAKKDGGNGTITISHVGLEVNVESTGNYNGAFVGNNWGATINFHIDNSYNTGNITGPSNNSVMGGYNWNSNVFTNVYNTGSVSNATDQFCANAANAGTFTNCYTTSTTDASVAGLTKSVTDEQVKSGELCYKLGSEFTQDLSAAGYPTFGSKVVAAGQWFSDADDVYYNLEGGNYTVYQLNMAETNTKYAVPANVTAKNVSVARTITADKTIGLCLPFDMAIPAGWTVYELVNVEKDGDNATMVFDKATAIVAAKPYLVKTTADVTTIEAVDAAIATAAATEASNGVNMIGTFAQGNLAKDDYYISTNGELKKLTADSATLKGFRVYFTQDGAGAKNLSIVIGDDTNAISKLNGNDVVVEGIYNLAGQRMSGLQKGINIVNGKKIIK